MINKIISSTLHRGISSSRSFELHRTVPDWITWGETNNVLYAYYTKETSYLLFLPHTTGPAHVRSIAYFEDGTIKEVDFHGAASVHLPGIGTVSCPHIIYNEASEITELYALGSLDLPYVGTTMLGTSGTWLVFEQGRLAGIQAFPTDRIRMIPQK